MMDKEIAAQLERIAGLLEKRLEIAERQQSAAAEVRQEALERFKEFKMPKIEVPRFSGEEAIQEMKKNTELDRQKRREFQSALLAELRRHNDLLEKILQSK